MEQRPRAQSRGHVITLEQGAGLIFPTNNRPVLGSRGYYKTTLRHGVSTITGGDWRAVVLVFINMAIGIVVYYPFWKAFEKAEMIKEAQSDVKNEEQSLTL
jgi:hypothetical protein